MNTQSSVYMYIYRLSCSLKPMAYDSVPQKCNMVMNIKRKRNLGYVYTRLLTFKWKFILGQNRKFIVRKISNVDSVFLSIILMVAMMIILLIMVSCVWNARSYHYHNYWNKIWVLYFVHLISCIRLINSQLLFLFSP